MSRDELITALLALPRHERALVAKELVRSLADEVPHTKWTELWGVELNQRIADMEAGAAGVSFDEVLDELEEAGGRKAS